MQLICDGEESKRDVLEASLIQYREVFIKAKRDFDILFNVGCFLVGTIASDS
jgi:DNA topoisomerase-3